jgi:hypothetical protein
MAQLTCDCVFVNVLDEIEDFRGLQPDVNSGKILVSAFVDGAVQQPHLHEAVDF